MNRSILVALTLIPAFLVSCSPQTPTTSLPAQETTSPKVQETLIPAPSTPAQEAPSPPTSIPVPITTATAPASPAPPSPVVKLMPLEYRKLDSFTAEAIKGSKDITDRASRYGYDLPPQIVVWDYFALYVAVQNLDITSGTFKVHYTITTADKVAAEKQMWLHARTPDEYAELKREYYEGTIELYLEPGKVGVAICPPEGIHIAPDRVPFDHKHEIIPDTKTITK